MAEIPEAEIGPTLDQHTHVDAQHSNISTDTNEGQLVPISNKRVAKERAFKEVQRARYCNDVKNAKLIFGHL